MKNGIKAIAAVTLVSFLTTQCAWGAPAAGIEMAGNREFPAYLSIDIPAELGTVDTLYEAPAGANPQFILHIQNAHANYQAQMKIKQLLGYMNKKYGFKTIFVEGASEKLDPDYLRVFPDQERNLKLSDELAKQGELTGAELFLMEADKNVEALGIEEASLYKSNYDALKIVFGAEADVTRFFTGFDGKLDRVASKTFTPETRELIADWKRFEQGRRDFMPFVQTLAKKSKKIMKVDLESLFAQVGWPQITRLLVIQQMEKEMDKARGIEEQAALIKMLRIKNVSKELLATLENFSEGSIAVGKSTREVSPREVLERLAAEAGPKGFKFSDYPAFSLYAGYVTLRSELDSKVLFEEIEYLFTQMLDTLASEAEQKTLLALYRDGELLRKLLHLELNRAQWRQAVEAKDRIGVPSLVSRLKDAVIASGDGAVQKDQQVMPRAFGGKMDELFTAGLEFYDYAHKREAVFYKEMHTAMTERKITKAILITGGFHTDGMSDLFRENAISYGIVTPRLSEKTDENLYRAVMLQNQESLFGVSNLEAIIAAMRFGAQKSQGAQDAVGNFIRTRGRAMMTRLDYGISEMVNAFNDFFGRIAAKELVPQLAYATVNGRAEIRMLQRSELPGITTVMDRGLQVTTGRISDLNAARQEAREVPAVRPTNNWMSKLMLVGTFMASIFSAGAFTTNNVPAGTELVSFDSLATNAASPRVESIQPVAGKVLTLFTMGGSTNVGAYTWYLLVNNKLGEKGEQWAVMKPGFTNMPSGMAAYKFLTNGFLRNQEKLFLGMMGRPNGGTNATPLVGSGAAAAGLAPAVTNAPVGRNELRVSLLKTLIMTGALIGSMFSAGAFTTNNVPAGTELVSFDSLATNAASPRVESIQPVAGKVLTSFTMGASTNVGAYTWYLLVNNKLGEKGEQWAVMKPGFTNMPSGMAAYKFLTNSWLRNQEKLFLGMMGRPNAGMKALAPAVAAAAIPLNEDQLETAVSAARDALGGTTSNVHIALSQDKTKVEIRELTKPSQQPLVLDAKDVVALAVDKDGAAYLAHRRSDNGQTQYLRLSPDLDLTKWTLGTNVPPVGAVIDGFNALPESVKAAFSAMFNRAEMRTGLSIVAEYPKDNVQFKIVAGNDVLPGTTVATYLVAGEVGRKIRSALVEPTNFSRLLVNNAPADLNTVIKARDQITVTYLAVERAQFDVGRGEMRVTDSQVAGRIEEDTVTFNGIRRALTNQPQALKALRMIGLGRTTFWDLSSTDPKTADVLLNSMKDKSVWGLTGLAMIAARRFPDLLGSAAILAELSGEPVSLREVSADDKNLVGKMREWLEANQKNVFQNVVRIGQGREDVEGLSDSDLETIREAFYYAGATRWRFSDLEMQGMIRTVELTARAEILEGDEASGQIKFDAPLSVLGPWYGNPSLNGTINRVFRDEGITTVGDLVGKSEADLLNHLGVRRVWAILRGLSAAGLYLGMDTLKPDMAKAQVHLDQMAIELCSYDAHEGRVAFLKGVNSSYVMPRGLAKGVIQLDAFISELEPWSADPSLNTRIIRFLQRAGFKSVADIVQKSESDLLYYRFAGRAVIWTIMQRLASAGLYLGMEVGLRRSGNKVVYTPEPDIAKAQKVLVQMARNYLAPTGDDMPGPRYITRAEMRGEFLREMLPQLLWGMTALAALFLFVMDFTPPFASPEMLRMHGWSVLGLASVATLASLLKPLLNRIFPDVSVSQAVIETIRETLADYFKPRNRLGPRSQIERQVFGQIQQVLEGDIRELETYQLGELRNMPEFKARVVTQRDNLGKIIDTYEPATKAAAAIKLDALDALAELMGLTPRAEAREYQRNENLSLAAVMQLIRDMETMPAQAEGSIQLRNGSIDYWHKADGFDQTTPKTLSVEVSNGFYKTGRLPLTFAAIDEFISEELGKVEKERAKWKMTAANPYVVSVYESFGQAVLRVGVMPEEIVRMGEAMVGGGTPRRAEMREAADLTRDLWRQSQDLPKFIINPARLDLGYALPRDARDIFVVSPAVAQGIREANAFPRTLETFLGNRSHDISPEVLKQTADLKIEPTLFDLNRIFKKIPSLLPNRFQAAMTRGWIVLIDKLNETQPVWGKVAVLTSIVMSLAAVTSSVVGYSAAVFGWIGLANAAVLAVTSGLLDFLDFINPRQKAITKLTRAIEINFWGIESVVHEFERTRTITEAQQRKLEAWFSRLNESVVLLNDLISINDAAQMAQLEKFFYRQFGLSPARIEELKAFLPTARAEARALTFATTATPSIRTALKQVVVEYRSIGSTLPVWKGAQAQYQAHWEDHQADWRMLRFYELAAEINREASLNNVYVDIFDELKGAMPKDWFDPYIEALYGWLEQVHKARLSGKPGDIKSMGDMARDWYQANPKVPLPQIYSKVTKTPMLEHLVSLMDGKAPVAQRRESLNMLRLSLVGLKGSVRDGSIELINDPLVAKFLNTPEGETEIGTEVRDMLAGRAEARDAATLAPLQAQNLLKAVKMSILEEKVGKKAGETLTPVELQGRLEEFLRVQGARSVSAEDFVDILQNAAFASPEAAKTAEAQCRTFFAGKTEVSIHEVFQFMLQYADNLVDTNGVPYLSATQKAALEETLLPVLLVTFSDINRKITKAPGMFHLLGSGILTLQSMIETHLVATQAIAGRNYQSQWAMDFLVASLYHDLVEDTVISIDDLRRDQPLLGTRKALQRIKNLTKMDYSLVIADTAFEGVTEQARASILAAITKAADEKALIQYAIELRRGPKSLAIKYMDILYNLSEAYQGVKKAAGTDQAGNAQKILAKTLAKLDFYMKAFVYHPDLPQNNPMFVAMANLFIQRVNFINRVNKVTDKQYPLLTAIPFEVVSKNYPLNEDQLIALSNIMKDPDRRKILAQALHDAYYNDIGEKPPTFDTSEKNIAINLAGAIAAIEGANSLNRKYKNTVLDVLDAIMDGITNDKVMTEQEALAIADSGLQWKFRISQDDGKLLAEFAHSTWEAGQPFKGEKAMAKKSFAPMETLPQSEVDKDYVQITKAVPVLYQLMVAELKAMNKWPANAVSRAEARVLDLNAGASTELLGQRFESLIRESGAIQTSSDRVRQQEWLTRTRAAIAEFYINEPLGADQEGAAENYLVSRVIDFNRDKADAPIVAIVAAQLGTELLRLGIADLAQLEQMGLQVRRAEAREGWSFEVKLDTVQRKLSVGNVIEAIGRYVAEDQIAAVTVRYGSPEKESRFTMDQLDGRWMDETVAKSVVFHFKPGYQYPATLSQDLEPILPMLQKSVEVRLDTTQRKLSVGNVIEAFSEFVPQAQIAAVTVRYGNPEKESRFAMDQLGFQWMDETVAKAVIFHLKPGYQYPASLSKNLSRVLPIAVRAEAREVERAPVEFPGHPAYRFARVASLADAPQVTYVTVASPLVNYTYFVPTAIFDGYVKELQALDAPTPIRVDVGGLKIAGLKKTGTAAPATTFEKRFVEIVGTSEVQGEMTPLRAEARDQKIGITDYNGPQGWLTPAEGLKLVQQLISDPRNAGMTRLNVTVKYPNGDTPSIRGLVVRDGKLGTVVPVTKENPQGFQPYSVGEKDFFFVRGDGVLFHYLFNESVQSYLRGEGQILTGEPLTAEQVMKSRSEAGVSEADKRDIRSGVEKSMSDWQDVIMRESPVDATPSRLQAFANNRFMFEGIRDKGTGEEQAKQFEGTIQPGDVLLVHPKDMSDGWVFVVLEIDEANGSVRFLKMTGSEKGWQFLPEEQSGNLSDFIVKDVYRLTSAEKSVTNNWTEIHNLISGASNTLSQRFIRPREQNQQLELRIKNFGEWFGTDVYMKGYSKELQSEVVAGLETQVALFRQLPQDGDTTRAALLIVEQLLNEVRTVDGRRPEMRAQEFPRMLLSSDQRYPLSMDFVDPTTHAGFEVQFLNESAGRLTYIITYYTGLALEDRNAPKVGELVMTVNAEGQLQPGWQLDLTSYAFVVGRVLRPYLTKREGKPWSLTEATGVQLAEERVRALYQSAKIDVEGSRGMTVKGIYVSTAQFGEVDQAIRQVRSGKEGPFEILDLGFGQGIPAFVLAALFPEAKVSGIEYGHAYAMDAAKALETAKAQGMPEASRITLNEGDFGDLKYWEQFQKTDVFYFYEGGTNNPKSLAAALTLQMKPGASVVTYGRIISDENRLPLGKDLFSKYFTAPVEVGAQITVYTRNEKAIEREDQVKLWALRSRAEMRGRILVADDESAIRELMTAVLESQGFQVVEANNGEEALALAAKEDFDVVHTDFMMGPGMRGPDLIRRVQKLKPGTKFLLVTGEEGEMVKGVVADLNDAYLNGTSVSSVTKPNIVAPVLERLNVWFPQQRQEMRSTIEEQRQARLADWIQNNFSPQTLETLKAVTFDALSEMSWSKGRRAAFEAASPQLQVAMLLTRGLVSTKGLPGTLAILGQIAVSVDMGTYQDLIAQLSIAVPSAKVGVNLEECVVGEIVEEIGNVQDFVDSLKFNFLLNPNARFLFLSLKRIADKGKKDEVMKWVREWGDQINNPKIVDQVQIQTPAESERNPFRAFQSAIDQAVAKSGKSGYVLAASERAQGLLGLDKALIAGVLIEEEFRTDAPDQRTAALNVLTKAAQRIRGISSEMIAGQLIRENSGIVRNKKNGFSITEASLKGVFANLSALFAAFKTIAKAA